MTLQKSRMQNLTHFLIEHRFAWPNQVVGYLFRLCTWLTTEQKKYSGHAGKLQFWFCVAETVMINEAYISCVPKIMNDIMTVTFLWLACEDFEEKKFKSPFWSNTATRTHLSKTKISPKPRPLTRVTDRARQVTLDIWNAMPYSRIQSVCY